MQENGQYEVGETYYAAGGAKVRLDAVTIGGQYVVSKLLRYEDFQDDFYEEFGPAEIVDKIFEKPPVEVVDADIAEKLARLADVTERHRKAFAEVSNLERETKSRLDHLKKFECLKRIEDWIDGKITHAVDIGHYSYAVLTIAEAVQRRDYGPKLMTLFGESKGNLEWRINEYRDGSGSWKTILPATSEEEAISLRDGRLIDDLTASFFIAFKKEGRSYEFRNLFKAAVRLGIPVTDQMRDDYAALAKAELLKAEEEAKRSVMQANTRLEQIRRDLAVDGAEVSA